MPDGARVAIAADEATESIAFRPTGACNALVCGTLAGFFRSLSPGAARRFYVDLSAGTSADSTFIGTLLKLALRRGSDAPAVHLVRPAPVIAEAMRRMNVLALFDVRDALPDALANWMELPAGPVDPEALADLVIEAHERLMDAHPENAAQFARVVEGFRAQRDQKRNPDA